MDYKIASIFDINTLITTNSKVWIVDKTKPNKPIIRIPKSEFNLIKNGVYKKDNVRLDISGTIYWLSTDLINRIKIKCKDKNLNMTNLSFSMKEFMDRDIIDSGDYTIHMEHIQSLKNSSDDIYIICSKNTKKNYEVIIDKLEEKLESIGLIVKGYYYLSETFYNRDNDYINNKKVKILIQHSIGLKTDDSIFTDTEIKKYDLVKFYDDEKNVIEFAKRSNDIVQFLLKDTDSIIKDKIKDIIRNEDCVIRINQVTFNKANMFIETEVRLKWDNLIKTFENFIYKK